MKYQANPVVVDAYKITGTSDREDDNSMDLVIETGDTVHATSEMLARMMPVPGDYWVIQSDGYVYLNPKDVFERKYSPAFDLGALQRLRSGSP